jgi:dUTP pyrophosphatase
VLILLNHGKNAFLVKVGMKIAQMVIHPVVKVEVKQVNQLIPLKAEKEGLDLQGTNILLFINQSNGTS